jgi:nicotinic acid mononucleotide adenylyltransferase
LHNDYREELNQSTNNVTKGNCAKNFKKRLKKLNRKRANAKAKVVESESLDKQDTNTYTVETIRREHEQNGPKKEYTLPGPVSSMLVGK